MKVITIAIVNGKVVNEKELIAGIIDYDDLPQSPSSSAKH